MDQIRSKSVFENQTFKNTSIEGEKLEEAEFLGCKFIKCDFSKLIFDKCKFENCEFDACNFSVAKFPNSRIVDSKFSNCKLIGIDWTLMRKEMGLQLNCKDCDLSYGVFLRTDISNSKFIDCKMVECEFSEAIAQKTSFRGSDLAKSTIRMTDLREADFVKAKNYYFNIQNNKVNKAKFSKPEVLILLHPFGIEIVDEIENSDN